MAAQVSPLYEPKSVNLLVWEEMKFVRDALDFADARFAMNWASQKMERDQWSNCKAWQLYTPKLFHLYNSHYYEMAECNTTALNDFMEKPLYPPTNVNVNMHCPPDNAKYMIKSDPRFALDPQDYWVGCYVAAMCGNKRDGKEYLRAVVVKQYRDEKGTTWVSLYKIDFGDHTDLELEKCRRIPKKFMRCAAVAMQCSMHFDGEYAYMNAPGWTWTSGEVAIWRDMMGDCSFRVQFVKPEIHEELPIPDKIIWKVRLHLQLLKQVADTLEGMKEGAKGRKKLEVEPFQDVQDGGVDEENFGDDDGLNEESEYMVDNQLFSVKLMEELKMQYNKQIKTWGNKKFGKESAGLPKPNSFWGNATGTGAGIVRLCVADPNWVMNLDINNRFLFK